MQESLTMYVVWVLVNNAITTLFVSTTPPLIGNHLNEMIRIAEIIMIVIFGMLV